MITQIIETSWEVCNKVGGIYTVLSSRVPQMIRVHGRDNLHFIGPYLGHQADFIAQSDAPAYSIQSPWGTALPVYEGRWQVEGNPHVLLVDFEALRSELPKFYYSVWEKYGIESDKGFGDYDTSCLFACASALLMLHLTEHSTKRSRTLFLFNEWTTGMGLLYLKQIRPQARTLFLTHATTVGRSIAGNGKQLYAYFNGYAGDQMAGELNVWAKHALEKAAAHQATVFATVSSVTAAECRQFLEREPVILPNGFLKSIVPTATSQEQEEVAKRVRRITECLYGVRFSRKPLLVATSGRYEYRNKGIDLVVRALNQLATTKEATPPAGKTARPLILLFLIPAWGAGPRGDLIALLKQKRAAQADPLSYPFLTHHLHNLQSDLLAQELNRIIEASHPEQSGIYPLFVPAYLDGQDGLFNCHYYTLLQTVSLTLFPSYYEPWGYTPLESIAYGVPTVTTSLSGFGSTLIEEGLAGLEIQEGVQVIRRDDANEEEVVAELSKTIRQLRRSTPRQRAEASAHALALSQRMTWRTYYNYYTQAYASAE